MINWHAFSWEAFATLMTGILAVGAAFAVGRRQLSIQEKQASLQELELRSDLFDRRYAVYDNVRKFLLHIIRDAQYPSSEIERDFLMAMGEAKFLFGNKVQAALQEMWERVGNYRVLKMEMERIYQDEGHYGDGNPKREHDLFIWISGRFSDLPDIFEELKLSGQLM
jgi:hypothetical protein